VFGLSEGTLESLVIAIEEYDFAVLALTPDDLVTSRSLPVQAPRDNVLFELGLFMGALGRNRTYLLFDRTAQLKLPTDLAGVTAATYERHTSGNLRAALGAAATQIEGNIEKFGVRPEVRSRQPQNINKEPGLSGSDEPSVDKNGKLVRDLASWLLSNEISDSLIRGIALREAGQYSRAIDVLETAARREPQYSRYYSNAAHAYAKMGKLDNAISSLLIALQIRRQNDGIEWPRHHYHVARYYMVRSASGDAESAKQHLAYAIAAGLLWEEKAIREAALFYNVIDDALTAAKNLKHAANRARQETINRVTSAISTIPDIVHCAIYGSYWLNGATSFRDIDVIAITSTPNSEAELITIVDPTDQLEHAPINIYVVPTSILFTDSTELTYGQFFSFKYVLGVESIVNEEAVETCALHTITYAIRDAVAWHYRRGSDEVFDYRYKSGWFVGMVLKRRLTRDKTFVRCLRRIFDHYNDDGLRRIVDLYGRALRELRRKGELADGPGRNDNWALSKEKLIEWESIDTASDTAIAERFWSTYEKFKSPVGNLASKAKMALTEKLPLHTLHDIENRIEELISNGRALR